MDKNLKNWQKFFKAYGYKIIKRNIFWKVFVLFAYITLLLTFFYFGYYFQSEGIFHNTINNSNHHNITIDNTYDFKPNNVVDNDYQFNPNYTIINKIEINCENWSN